ncbi:hypothetical protein J2T07_002307 [Luteibacter jiangsuensis]|uniref:Carbohydrate binding protein n=1 Tax=Luteibacter jiangsuensis TaxID=637577 RepID=A0ABT9T1W2_9GAMM|nr:hypothetical protein [Luteibacter jiangsuensis]MDQ0010117.1 hypothetical protein [Luteibacter jiangsuensis]
MISLKSLYRPAFAMALCATAGTAVAGNGPDPSGLPLCQQVSGADACRLPVRNGQFDNLDGWTRTSGLPSIGYDPSGNPYASLYTGAGIHQAVYAHFGTLSQEAAYVLRFRVRSDNGDTQVRATLSMSDGDGANALPLGSTATMAREGEWSSVELVVNGAAFAAPAHVLLEIANEGGNHDTVQVDDVYLVQSVGVEMLRRR